MSWSPGLALLCGEVVEGRGEVGQEGGGVGFGQRAVVLDSFGDGGQGCVVVPGLTLVCGEVVEGHGEVG